MKHLIIVMLLIFGFQLQAQSLEDEIGFIYTKAKYLLDTDRIEEAVTELNKVITKDLDFENALLLRAEAKYVLGAYTGVKKDLNLYIEKKGITARVARLYGLTDYQGGNIEAALNSLTMALHEIKDDKKMYEFRAQIYEDNNELEKACMDYHMADQLGSGLAKRKMRSICVNVVIAKSRGPEKNCPNKNPSSSDTKSTDTNPDNDSDRTNTEVEPGGIDYGGNTENDNNDGNVLDGSSGNDDEVYNNQNEDDQGQHNPNNETQEGDIVMDKAYEEELDDGTINEIFVDEELTLIIMEGGLGRRELLNQPNILIISDDSGDVAIDICVSKGGRVTSAVYDNQNSSIKKQSLVSLAIRKSKEFWFEKSGRIERCGKIVFRIKGT